MRQHADWTRGLSYLLIVGCGGHARSVADVALDAGIARLCFVDPQALPGERIFGFPVLTPAAFDVAHERVDAVILGLGDNGARARSWEELSRTMPIVPPARIVAGDVHIGRDARVGPGTFVGHAAHIGPSAVIGEDVIINTRAIVEHECSVGAHTHIAVNAVMLGRTRVGDRVLLGAGAVVLDGVTIVSDVTIGAGAVVATDIYTPGTYVGVPARRIS